MKKAHLLELALFVTVAAQPACIDLSVFDECWGDLGCDGSINDGSELNYCVFCEDDSDCTEYSYSPYCQGGMCTECKYDYECPYGPQTCETSTGICWACEVDADCMGAFCSAHMCVLCLTDDDCSSDSQCHNHYCEVRCSSDSDCTSDPFYVCDDGSCVMCTSDDDCEGLELGQRCDTSLRFCACESDDECTHEAVNGTCAPFESLPMLFGSM